MNDRLVDDLRWLMSCLNIEKDWEKNHTLGLVKFSVTDIIEF